MKERLPEYNFMCLRHTICAGEPVVSILVSSVWLLMCLCYCAVGGKWVYGQPSVSTTGAGVVVKENLSCFCLVCDGKGELVLQMCVVVKTKGELVPHLSCVWW